MTTRKHFIGGVIAAGAAPVIVPSSVFGANAPSNRVTVGGIGVGGIGHAQLPQIKAAGFEVVALCDLDWDYAKRTFDKFPDARRYKDYEEMLRHFAKICELCAKNDFRSAAKWQAEANRLVDIVVDSFSDNWSAFKVLMKGVGIDCGYCRAPYAPLTKAQERKVLARFAALGLVPMVGRSPRDRRAGQTRGGFAIVSGGMKG